jgi:Mrp family chromosome partitioning ATPase
VEDLVGRTGTDVLARDVSTGTGSVLSGVRRLWIWMLLGAAVGGAAGMYAGPLVPAQYASTATLLVAPVAGTGTNATGTRTNSGINMDDELQLIKSVEVAEAVKRLLGSTLDAGALRAHVTVVVPANTSAMSVTFQATGAAAAKDGAHAYATAYLQERTNRTKAGIAAQLAALAKQLATAQQTLAGYAQKVASLTDGDPEKVVALAQVDIVKSTISQLEQRQLGLAVADPSGGRIIDDADLSTAPVTPVRALYGGGGAAVGLVFAVGLALAVSGRRTKLRDSTQVVRDLGRDVIVTLEAPRRTPGSAAGRRRRRPAGSGPRLDDLWLRLESMLRDDLKLVVVCGAAPGHGPGNVAADLAASLARSNHDTTFVIADPGSSAAQLFRPADRVGLSDYLSGASAAEVIQQAAGWQNLDLILAGPALAEAAERAPATRTIELVDSLARSGRWVVVEAPPAMSGTMTRQLGRAAGAVVVVVELRRTRSDTAADAVDALERAGASVPGLVAVSQAYARRAVDRSRRPSRRRHVRTADANA